MPTQSRPTALAPCTPRGRPDGRAVAALLAGLSLVAYAVTQRALRFRWTKR